MTNNPTIDGVSRTKVHHLKIQRKPFDDLVSGRKTGEVRDCSDRDFKEGDHVELFLVDEAGSPANKSIVRTITHIQRGYGLPDDICVLSYAAPVVERCTSCDDSGDLTDLTGEWRGYCVCPIGEALKNKPVVERQPAAPFYISIDDWNLLVRGDVEIASVRISRTRRSIFTESLFAHPPELAALQSEIERGEQHRNDLADTVVLQKTEIAALQSTIAQLQAQLAAQKENLESAVNNSIMFAEKADELQGRIAELEKNAARYQWLRDKSESCNQFYLSTPLYFTGVKFSKENVDSTIDACLDATAALNEKQKQ